MGTQEGYKKPTIQQLRFGVEETVQVISENPQYMVHVYIYIEWAYSRDIMG